MKVACLQFNPIIGEVERNQNFASKLLERFRPGDFDILVLPEMAFTGYVFKNKKHIEPFLEDAEAGPTVQWAKNQAMRLHTFVMVGYPQIVKGNPDKFYNSACFVGPDGGLIDTYSKTFLFMTDENWADEGPGFKAINVPGLGKIGFGICMDINPYKYMAPFDAYEFANFHLQQQTDIILCSMAWLLSNGEYDSSDEDAESPKTSTIDYWIQRLFPLINGAEYSGFRSDVRNPETAIKRNVLFVACNRTGTEEGVSFCGSSTIMSISSRGEIHTLGSLGKHQEDVIVVDVPSL